MPPAFEDPSHESIRHEPMTNDLLDFFTFFDTHQKDTHPKQGKRASFYDESVSELYGKTTIQFHVRFTLETVTDIAHQEHNALTLSVFGRCPLHELLENLTDSQRHMITDGDPDVRLDESWTILLSIQANWGNAHGAPSAMHLESSTDVRPTIQDQDDDDAFFMDAPNAIPEDLLRRILKATQKRYTQNR